MLQKLLKEITLDRLDATLPPQYDGICENMVTTEPAVSRTGSMFVL